MTTAELKNELVIDVPEPPFPIREKGMVYWCDLYKQLAGETKLEPADVYLLARYCTTLAEWLELDAYSRLNDPFKEMISSKGVAYFAKDPRIARLETIEPLLLRMEKQLGIGANARVKKKGAGKVDEDLERLLKGGA